MSRHKTKQTHSAERLHFSALCAMFVAATAFGGGGSRYGLANLLVQLVGLVALALHRQAFLDFWARAPLALRALIASSIVLLLLFLIPLPPQLWSALPGRELVSQSYEIAGTLGWASASVDPIRTLLALTAIVTPFALLMIGWQARRDHLINLGWVIVLLGIANLMIGAVQVLTNGETGLFYPENPMPGVLFGTFANRNSTGLFLVGCLALAALLPVPAKAAKIAIPARISICLLLLLAIVLTRSRTALVLAALPLGALALQIIGQRLRSHVPSASGKRKGIFGVIAAVSFALCATSIAGLAGYGRVGDVAQRFQDSRTDARTYIWEDATYSASRFWPIGSGIGTFDEVFQLDESLENMTSRRAGRAHNDYLEVAIEAGVPGILLIVGWLLLVASLSWKARLSNERWIAWSGAITLLAIALQSITDYPLRNHTLLALAGFSLVILVRFSVPRRGVKR